MPTQLRVPSVNASQVEVGRKLGLDLRGMTERVASAHVSQYISQQFWGQTGFTSPSPKQCALAEEFGFDISNQSRLVGSAVIDDIMDHLNKEAITNEELAPGVVVRFRSCDDGSTRIISSINSDGTVYFKGGNGQKAWARSLERIR